MRSGRIGWNLRGCSVACDGASPGSATFIFADGRLWAGYNAVQTLLMARQGTPLRPNPPRRRPSTLFEIYNLADKGRFARPTVRVAMDGSWVGATQGFSYLPLSGRSWGGVTCAFAGNPGLSRLSQQQIALYNFDAVAGRTYYFRVPIMVEGASDGSAVLDRSRARLRR